MTEKKTTKAPDPLVKVRHETDRHDFTLSLGEQSFAVVAGETEVPLSLLDAAELAGFRRVG